MRFIHILVVMYICLIPFIGSKEHLQIHSIIVPFLFFHWLTNNDTCALTELEKILSKKKYNEDTFIGSILSPIYKMSSNKNINCQIVKMTKIVTLILWCFSLEKI